MEPTCYKTAVRPPFASYREFLPCEALRPYVRALFSFVPGSALASPPRSVLREIAFRKTIVCAPQLADGHVSVRFEIGQSCGADGRWRADANALGGTLLGPMTSVGRVGGLDLSETVGAYFRPGCASRFFDTPVSELADTAMPVGTLWGTRNSPSSSELADLAEAPRVDRLEAVLLARLRHQRQRTTSLDVEGLAGRVLRGGGRATVEGMARAAGVSRQHLTRAFRERIGVGPKLYCRLARFQSVLVHAGSRVPMDWARVALDAGFADQSHMIAECRRFSGLTPQALADGDWFHPFIEAARSTRCTVRPGTR